MKHIGIVALLLLMAAGAGESTAQTKTDTTKVKSDSITWSKELDGVVIKAQKQLVKQEIDRIDLRRGDVLVAKDMLDGIDAGACLHLQGLFQG